MMPNAQEQSRGAVIDYSEVAACPSCGSARRTVLFKEKCETVEVAIVECMDCALGYSTPRPTESYKLRRYEEWARKPRPWEAKAHFDHRQQLRHFHLYKRVMELIHVRVPSGRLLDVGCGGGLFLILAGTYASADNAGIDSRYQVEGAGFDPHEVQLSREISGASVHHLSELGHGKVDPYDAITLLNVLEHVNQPLDLLCQLRGLMTSRGVLVVVVPNNSGAFWKLRHGLSRETSFAASEHINHFCKASLEFMIRRAGFQNLRFFPALASGTYGSMAVVPKSQYMKHAAYRFADILSQGRLHLYSEIICLARLS